jgi:hypothetical protein
MDINEILGLDKKAFDINYNDYQNWKCITPLQAKEAIKEIVQETLRMAAEDAKVVKSYDKWTFSEDYEVDKDSITNVINKIKF